MARRVPSLPGSTPPVQLTGVGCFSWAGCRDFLHFVLIPCGAVRGCAVLCGSLCTTVGSEAAKHDHPAERRSECAVRSAGVIAVSRLWSQALECGSHGDRGLTERVVDPQVAIRLRRNGRSSALARGRANVAMSLVARKLEDGLRRLAREQRACPQRPASRGRIASVRSEGTFSGPSWSQFTWMGYATRCRAVRERAGRLPKPRPAHAPVKSDAISAEIPGLWI